MSTFGDPLGENWLKSLSSGRRHVFISHASEDVEIAFTVAAMLKRYLDIDSHVDQLFLRAGGRWKSDIEAKIRSSELLIVLRSRTVEAGASPGVDDEIDYARTINIPVVYGSVRGHRAENDYHQIDFGEDGSRVGAVWDVAKYLLTESHPFRILGLGTISVGTASVASILGDPEVIAAREGRITILGHTMKQWFSNYGNAIRHARSEITMYFPRQDATGMDLLVASHRNGDRVLGEIRRVKEIALALENEIDDPDRFQVFVIPVKPMFSATLVEPSDSESVLVVDPYSFRVGAESRPKLIMRGTHTPLYTYHLQVVQNVLAEASPLRDEFGPPA